MHSRIYSGQVKHRRLIPHKHEFSYQLFMMFLDLDELDDIFAPYWLWSANGFNLAWFNRNDHMGKPSQSLKQSISDFVYEQSGIQLAGPIRLLTHLRYFGYGFNPVSFYYCYDQQDNDIEVIVAEVNNTPWGEQHCYIMSSKDNHGDNEVHRYEFQKSFHVSPFNPMDQDYKWSISVPQQQLLVHIQNWRSNEKVFDATLSLEAKAINAHSLSKVLLQFPLLTAKISAAIYFEALKLWLKGTPLFTHPKKPLPSQVKNN